MQTFRVRSRTAVTSKMERFVIIVNGFQPLTIITKRSILDVAAVLDPPLDIPGFELPSVITGEERRPDIVIRDTNKLYIIELTVGFETRILINAERKLKHYENLCKELSQGFESVI